VTTDLFSEAPNYPERCLSVLIPAYNEERTIRRVIDKVLQLPMLKEVIVVDDCSEDSTGELVKTYTDPRVLLLRMPKNSGKTAAIARALEAATGDVIITQDADLEYDPTEIPAVIDPILQGQADVVYGSRFLVRRATRVLYFYHFVANQLLTTLCNMFTNLNMTDIETGYKAFRAAVIKDLPLTSRGFGMEVEITACVARLPVRVFEVPISYYGRTYQEGKKIGMRDAVDALRYILYYNTLGRNESVRRAHRQAVVERLEREAAGRTAVGQAGAGQAQPNGTRPNGTQPGKARADQDQRRPSDVREIADPAAVAAPSAAHGRAGKLP
jgi:glycosyltransferase involved in cell wall biosynthesis